MLPDGDMRYQILKILRHLKQVGDIKGILDPGINLVKFYNIFQ